LPPRLQELLDTAERLAVSAISCWEIAYLERLGRTRLPLSIDGWLHAALTESNIESLPLTTDIAACAASLPFIHRDPADRFIIATALRYHLPLVSLDEKFPQYPELGGLLVSH
jgi:PIN domain nuclease of toxin-antitoxin system